MEQRIECNGVAERKKSAGRGLALLLAGGLALAACGNTADGSDGSSSAASGGQTEASAATGGKAPVMLVFDDLRGGSSTIRVYPGVTEAPADRVHNGTYPDGESVVADCKIVGRIVHSDTALNEENRTSDAWIRIHGTPGEMQYATAIYVENPDDLLSSLRDC